MRFKAKVRPNQRERTFAPRLESLEDRTSPAGLFAGLSGATSGLVGSALGTASATVQCVPQVEIIQNLPCVGDTAVDLVDVDAAIETVTDVVDCVGDEVTEIVDNLPCPTDVIPDGCEPGSETPGESDGGEDCPPPPGDTDDIPCPEDNEPACPEDELPCPINELPCPADAVGDIVDTVTGVAGTVTDVAVDVVGTVTAEVPSPGSALPQAESPNAGVEVNLEPALGELGKLSVSAAAGTSTGVATSIDASLDVGPLTAEAQIVGGISL